MATPLFRHVDTPLGLSVRVLGDVDARSSAMPAVVRNNGVRMNAATFAECEGGYT